MSVPRIRDVAALAGVAPSTVSVVLNGKATARVSDDTRRRIHEAAEQLGYTPNVAARRLRTTPERAVAVVAEDDLSTLPYGLGLLDGLYRACWEQGVRVLLLPTGGEPTRLRDALDHAAGQQVSGTILASIYHRRIEAPRSRGLVLLNLETAQTDSPVTTVLPDERSMAALVVDELCSLGHEQVGLVTIAPSLEAESRLAGLRAAWEQQGRADDDLRVHVSPDFAATTAGGLEGALSLLDRPDRPTALACFNDRMAMGAYEAARRLGLRIPEDLTVIGHDNLEPIVESLHPPLTTVAPPHQEMAEKAVELVLAAEAAPETFSLPGDLVRRDSTARPAPQTRTR